MWENMHFVVARVRLKKDHIGSELGGQENHKLDNLSSLHQL